MERTDGRRREVAHVEVEDRDGKERTMCAASWKEGCAHFALWNRDSWNSYDQRWPDGPIVRAVEWVKDPEPVPIENEHV